MKATISTLIIVVLLTGILVACTSVPTDSVIIKEQDAGKTIELRTGDTLVVALEGNLTTGYTWIPAPQAPALLEQMGDAAVTPAGSQLGSPGTIVLRFKAAAKGQTRLHLDYKRSWEEGTAPEKTFDVTVVVK